MGQYLRNRVFLIVERHDFVVSRFVFLLNLKNVRFSTRCNRCIDVGNVLAVLGFWIPLKVTEKRAQFL